MLQSLGRIDPIRQELGQELSNLALRHLTSSSVFWSRPVMSTCAPSAMKSRAEARPMPLLPPVVRAFLPVGYIMLPFCRTGVRYDARHAYVLMTIIDGGCKNNYALSRTFKRSATQFFS